MPLLSETRKRPSDVIAVEFHWTYNRVSVPINNDGLAALTVKDPTGQPVVVDEAAGEATFVLAGDEADANGVVVQGPPIVDLAAAATTTKKYAVLFRGPAAVRPEGLADNDVAGGALDKAAIITALAGLDVPIIAVDEAVPVIAAPNA